MGRWGQLWAVVVSAFALREVFALYGIVASVRFLLRGLPADRPSSADVLDIFLVVPTLREANVIGQTVRYLQSLDDGHVHVVVVTTERETAEQTDLSVRTTRDVLEEMKNCDGFVHLHYPDENGTKANQMNYAVRHIVGSIPHDQVARSFIAFYDADSRPHPLTFRCVRDTAAQYPSARVFQQSSFFYSNANDLARGGHAVRRAFLLANAVRQTRFTLAYEIPRLRARLAYYWSRRTPVAPSLSGAVGRYRYAHTVGHGLFVRADLAQEIPFPEGGQLEDMFYGFMLNVMNEPVVPLQMVDNCEMPSSVSSLFQQRSRWFLGPSRPVEYLRYSRVNVPVRAPLHEQLGLTASCWFDAVVWAAITPIFLGSVTTWLLWATGWYPVATMNAILCGVAASLYVGTVCCMLLIRYRRLGVVFDLDAAQCLSIFAALPLVLCFHSLPAYHCMFKRVTRRSAASYGKTER